MVNCKTKEEKIEFFKKTLLSLIQGGQQASKFNVRSYKQALRSFRGFMVAYYHSKLKTVVTLQFSEKYVLVETNKVNTDPELVFQQLCRFAELPYFNDQHKIFERLCVDLAKELFPAKEPRPYDYKAIEVKANPAVAKSTGEETLVKRPRKAIKTDFINTDYFESPAVVKSKGSKTPELPDTSGILMEGETADFEF